MTNDRRLAAVASTCLATLVFVGCERAQPKVAAPRPPVVTVSLPTTDEVTDYEEFTGRTDSIHSIEIRSRVTGYLLPVHFKDGDEVEKDAPLFDIDSGPYDAEFARAEATVVQSEAHLKRLDADYRRASNLYSRGNVSREEFDKTAGDRAEAEASVGIALASRKMAQLDVDFCKIKAPITGRLSRRLLDPGNLVKADDTPLTTIVSLDPLYVYFDIDDRTLLQLRRLVRAGKIQSRSETEIAIDAGLTDEDDFPHKGVINFSDNKLDANTGTLRVRASIANPKPRVLSPGLFMRVRLPIGKARKALLVPEQALGTDQGRKYLYVVDSHDEVVYRPVKVGRLDNGKRVIEEGLAPDERVILTGLQRVRPGAKVQPKLASEPGTPGKAAAPAPSGQPAPAARG
jgi:RND family efflux transporter MFP subunit